MSSIVWFRWLQWSLAGTLLLGMGGCTALGLDRAKPLTAEGARQALQIGMSTRADVTRVLGKAKVNAFASGYEVWVYDYKPGLPMFAGAIPVVGTLSSLADAVTRDRELAILFDPQGVVRKYTLRESASKAERLLLPH